MPQNDHLLKNFISKLSPELLNSPQVQKMALDVYYTSVTNVICNNMDTEEANKLLQRTASNGGTLDIMRDEIPGFDEKVFGEFTKLIKDKAANDFSS